LPVIGVLLLAQSSNILFGWAGSYDSSANMTSMQIVFFTLCSIALVSALSIYKNQQIINKLNSEELNTQRALNASQNTLIQEIDFTLSNDISSVEKFMEIMTSTSSASSFRNGVNDLKQLHNKMRLINSAHHASNQAAILHPIDIRNSLNTVMSELNPILEAKNIKTKINITDEGRINISHEHLYLLLKSIIKNAIMFNTQDGLINISTQYSKNMTIIQIEDTGIGIEKDKINNIFKPFYRAVDSTVYNYEGVGLDLYVCKAIVDNLNGNIQIESKQESGTKVTVHLQ
ncbi:HAMP domain-containing histidine kinase, partial [Candidatus Saccharibacteria bacterium]|nr:HAMP domain-containing histidine kinase [Candidatus Saccharibacteria bacterium]